MRVVGSSAARVWRMTQNASPFPHFGQSARVRGRVSMTSSRMRVSAGRSSRFTTRATRASFDVMPRSYPHFWHANLPSAGKRRDPQFGQNMSEGAAPNGTANTFRSSDGRRAGAPRSGLVPNRATGRGRRAFVSAAVRRLVLAERPFDPLPRCDLPRDVFLMVIGSLPLRLRFRLVGGVPRRTGVTGPRTAFGPRIRAPRINILPCGRRRTGVGDRGPREVLELLGVVALPEGGRV